MALADAVKDELTGEHGLSTEAGVGDVGSGRDGKCNVSGLIRVSRVVGKDGDTEYWSTNDAAMGKLERRKYAEIARGIEVYYRALKQECGVERTRVRAARAQHDYPPVRGYPGMAIRAFVRLE